MRNKSIEELFYDIMDKDESFNILVNEVITMLEQQKEQGIIKNYTYETDIDVYDSCGLDIFYISICWIDKDNNLKVTGTSYYNS